MTKVKPRDGKSKGRSGTNNAGIRSTMAAPSSDPGHAHTRTPHKYPPDLPQDTLTHKEVIKLGVSAQPILTPEAEKAIIADKVAGSTNAAIAIRYQVSEHTVSRVYRQFIQS